tara:strand:+ start:274 stop:657 length:384 start_codon:yes stop_codon:yes gene_type:complete
MSEVFQWTDENGQTHFSDRAPKLIQSNNISEQLNNINITSDLSSPEMMLRHEQTKDAEREAKYKKQQEKRNKQPTKSERCKEAQDLLRRVKGRVVFVDEQGKELKVSEEDRKQRAIQLESLVRKLCQ